MLLNLSSIGKEQIKINKFQLLMISKKNNKKNNNNKKNMLTVIIFDIIIS